MRRPRGRGRGFTLIETMLALAIVAILGALAYGALGRSQSRSSFDGVAAEIQSLIHAARQQALSSGVPVAVLVFPNHATSAGQGRIVVIQDDASPASSLFNATATLNFDNYDPAVLASPPGGKVVTSLDLPQHVQVGPATGRGSTPLPFPYSGIATNVACSFCNTAGNLRGAIVFDGRGRASFFSAVGAASGAASGASFSIYATDLAGPPTHTYAITAATGMVRSGPNG